MSYRSRRSEEGAATVLGLLLAGLIVCMALAVAVVANVVGTHRQAQAAADLAALGGAAALQSGGEACAQASTIARRNGGRLRRCSVDGFDVRVVVSAQTVRLPWGSRELPARGRAGPAIGPAIG